MRTGTRFFERRVNGIVFGLLVAVALAAETNAATTPVTSPTPASSASPNATQAPSATPLPSPIVPPRDAPPVRSTTPPFVPATSHSRPPPPDSLWLGNASVVNVPMIIHAERPFIQVLIDGHPATVIIDTAAITTMVDTNTTGETGATTEISLQIGDLRFPRLQAQRADVRAYSETHLGAEADAIIGRDLLQRYPVVLDYPNRALTVFRDSHGAAAALPSGAVSLALRVIEGRPAIQAVLDGQSPLWFALGTGAGYEILLNSSAEHSGRFLHPEHSIPFQEAMPGGDLDGMLVRAHSLTLGSLTFNQPLLVVSSATRVQPRSELSGGLGATLFSRLTLSIDEISGSAAVVALPSATSARFYDPSGIALVMRRGAIIVHSVVPGTPADGHLREGDEIVTINGLAPATLDFARQLLDGAPGTKVVVAYRRWHLIHYVTLPLHVII